MYIGSGIAIAGVWIGVGIIGINDGGSAAFAAMFAAIATFFVALFSMR